MKLKLQKALIAVLVGISSLAAFADDQPAAKEWPIAPPDKDKVSYALGMRMGAQLKEAYTNVNVKAFADGVKDVMEGKPTRITPTEAAELFNRVRTKGAAGEIEKDNDRASYAGGMRYGLQLKSAWAEVDTAVMGQGIKDILEDKPTRVKDAEMPALFKQAQAYALQQRTERNKIDGAAFLAKNAREEGVKVLPDGLQYRVLQAGTGAIPTTNDLLIIKYRGNFVDGTLFDHHDRFITRANGGLKGWQDALALMKVGSHWQIVLPPELGFGHEGDAYKHVAPEATLIYDLELVTIGQPGDLQMNTGVGHGLDAGNTPAKTNNVSDPAAAKGPIGVGKVFAPESTDPAAATPLKQLAWETDHKELNTKETDLTADFKFAFTNISDTEIVIDHVKTSCSCTAAKLPSEPWHLPAHTNGEISITVDLKNKMGEFSKTANVFFGDTNVPPKVLTVHVKMPDRGEMRERNMKLAAADRQAVFKGDCAKCHAEPAKTETGMVLFHDICGVCHEARPRASMMPDLRLLPHPTDLAFWREMIAKGKPGTLMPAFAVSAGGPLTDEQIDALARTIEDAYPYARFAGHPPQAQTPPPSSQAANPAPPSLPKN